MGLFELHDNDAESRDDIIRMEVESLNPEGMIKFDLLWTQEVSDMYAELDMEDCD